MNCCVNTGHEDKLPTKVHEGSGYIKTFVVHLFLLKLLNHDNLIYFGVSWLLGKNNMNVIMEVICVQQRHPRILASFLP